MPDSETPRFKYLWTAYFSDGKVIEQPQDDRYSKHDDSAEHNPSAFRDILDHQELEDVELIYFDLNDGSFAYGIDLPSGRFGINGTWFSLEQHDAPLTDRKLIYYRGVKVDHRIGSDGVSVDEPEIEAYYFGYEGKDASGKVVKKVIRID